MKKLGEALIIILVILFLSSLFINRLIVEETNKKYTITEEDVIKLKVYIEEEFVIN